ncbi:MAG: S9 family peptidase [Blastocatellia bacterium]|nr:S9 family peptidase [Blastocatellia bacterium]
MDRVKGKISFLLSALLMLLGFKYQTPDSGLRTPDFFKVQTPDSGLRTPDFFKVQTPDSGLRTPDSFSYQRPPKIIQDLLDASASPLVSLSPSRDRMLLIEIPTYPAITDLSEPMLRLAGLRFNPRTNGPPLAHHITGMTIKNIESGRELKISIPPRSHIGFPNWSPDGKRFVFTNTTAHGVELWIGNAATGQIHPLLGLSLNGAYADPVRWMPDNRTLVCLTIVSRRDKPPVKTAQGPNVRESFGAKDQPPATPGNLQNPYDEALFEYYATSQVVLFDSLTGDMTSVGAPAIVSSVKPSPDGAHLLVVTNHRPFSYLLPATAFPKEVEVWDLGGRVEYRLASLPLAANLPDGGVLAGPRCYGWRPTEPATLFWAEALDGGDPKKRAPHRDRILMLRAPFQEQTVEIAKTEYRFQRIMWGEKNGLAILVEKEGDRMRAQTVDVDDRLKQPRTLWSRSLLDRSGDPGEPVMKALPNGQKVILQYGDSIYLESPAPQTGDGVAASSLPFLMRYDLATGQSESLFQCDDHSYESVIELLADDASRFLTRSESPLEAPNYYLRTPRGEKIALTNFRTPHYPIRKQLVTYRRDDGQRLSFMLYLPEDYQVGVRLPTLLWVYPYEYSDARMAGREPGASNRFRPIRGASHIFLALAGYAVLDASVPIVGKDLQTVNDTYLEQIVAGAEAVVNKAVEMGVTDRNRIGVGGHSYGAFMAVNLLAHSDLFKAGIARSGAYNRTLTPFGFQNERRTLWEAPQLYLRVSPFMLADRIKQPLLLIHGENDDNVEVEQSERMYEAVKGNGGNVRYVSLPFESHGYEARESVEHVLWEMITWCDGYVKQSRPAAGSH